MRALDDVIANQDDPSAPGLHSVLRNFLDKEHHLCLLRHLVSINELHRVMSQHFAHKVNKAEAMTLTLGSREFKEMFQ
jgi:hypothetical protein